TEPPRRHEEVTIPAISAAALTPAPTMKARDGEPAIDRLFREMVHHGASDLHLSAASPPQIRRDGEMRPLAPGAEPLSTDDVFQLLTPIVPGKNRAQFEQYHDPDFAYEIEGVRRFRANIFLDRKGMGAVFRRVPTEIMSIDELALPPAVRRFCALQKGLVLVTGPTGSGKSTTIAAMIDH